ncbi:DUF6515 family protein [Paucibacter sp. APW11]|uniref:DUF6515 family protein n=1 Tax=Roseateles aquae TaxID=3077235 RepID=A0ABU3PIM0_9BURK|nr:DUF6515 family protein [Paucibacter sp. APW11]MDT9002400.1 DUF6515 family protein [Paucibacter sp. APW11]
MNGSMTMRIAAACAALLFSGLAAARDHVSVGVQLNFDNRYHHDHYYPGPGYVERVLPPGAVVVAHHADRYYFHGGVWYRPWSRGYRVIMPPVGVIIPILPPAYVTLRVGGMPYYYANGIYYAPAVGAPGYVVVQPPAGAETAAPAPAPAPARPDPIIYPRNGQTAQQTEADRQECNRWATSQPAAMNDAGVFNRAVEACMDGRGYSMR